MIKKIIAAAVRPVWSPVKKRVESIVNRAGEIAAADAERQRFAEVARATSALAELERAVHARIDTLDWTVQHLSETALRRNAVFVPDPLNQQLPLSADFMAYSNCQAGDFFHPRYAELCKLMAQAPVLQRKQWEWVFVMHHLIKSGVVKSGARGLVFGVGTEPLPAVFASMGAYITATDAPPDMAVATNWVGTNQQSATVEQLYQPAITSNEIVRERVTHLPCDMNHIDPALANFDFNWSSCCFEHLGNLELGAQFVINAVEKTLKVGGLAVHTTEYNASSNDATVSEGGTVIYRHRDIDNLIARLRDRGHKVEPFVIGPTAHALDFHVDVPPYSHNPHLKLMLMNYVATSVGMVVQRMN